MPRRLVQVEVEVGQSDDGLWVVGQIRRQSLAYVALHDERAPYVAAGLSGLMRLDHRAEVGWIPRRDGEPAGDRARADLVDVGDVGKTSECVEADDPPRGVVVLVDAA